MSKDRNLKLKEDIQIAINAYHRPPKLAIILVGNNPASLSYVKGKNKACKLVGIENDMYHLDENISENELKTLIQKLNDDHNVDGILLQLPIPKHLDEDMFIDLIAREKDADGFHVINQGYLYQKKEDDLSSYT